MAHITTPNDLIMTIASLVSRYKLGVYFFRNGNFINPEAVGIKDLPLLVYYEKNATIGQSQMSVTFDLMIIRTADAYLECDFDINGAKDGTNPPDKMDYQFLQYLLTALQHTTAGGCKKWEVVNGTVISGNTVGKDYPTLEGAYLFQVVGIIARAEQPQYINIQQMQVFT